MPNVHQQVHGETNCGASYGWNTIQGQQEWSLRQVLGKNQSGGHSSSAPLSQPPLATSPKLKPSDFPKMLTLIFKKTSTFFMSAWPRSFPANWLQARKFLQCHWPEDCQFLVTSHSRKLCTSSPGLYKLSGTGKRQLYCSPFGGLRLCWSLFLTQQNIPIKLSFFWHMYHMCQRQ